MNTPVPTHYAPSATSSPRASILSISAYQYQHNDLTVGPKGFPYGLSFERSYDSGAQGNAGPLGAGWTHNYAITAAVNSDGFTGMGQGSALAAVNSIVALYVSSDLVNSSNTVNGVSSPNNVPLENYVLETVVNRWFTDQLTNNVVNVSQGWSTEEFTLMANGSYAPPVGSATILSGTPTSFQYSTKTGITMNFNSSGQISSWINAAGASVSFGYSGGVLTGVTSATGRNLTLNYSGGQISSVSDGNRTVYYGYGSGNLTSFTDVLSQQTTFAYDTTGAYDTAGHLTQVFYPSSNPSPANPTNPFVTNFYDGLGRVQRQKDALGNLTQAFFAGSRTEIDDPAGNQYVLYNDPRGNVLEAIQDYGLSPHLNITTLNAYDAQSNLIKTTMPEGNSVTYTYDPLFNPMSITQTAKTGSSTRVQSFTYTTPVSSLPNFEEVYKSTDPNDNITTYTYATDNTGNLWKIDQPAVPKPGVSSNEVPEQVFTYTIGLPLTAQDAEGRVTHYDYYSGNADQLQKLTVDYNNLKLVTQYSYDSYGDVVQVEDANGNYTNSSYDALRRLTQVMVQSNPETINLLTNYAYYPDGQVNTVSRTQVGVSVETTQYTYTLSDKVHVVTDPLGNTTTTNYDVDDRVQTVTQQVTATQNRQRTYSYDALSRLVQLSDTTAGSPGTVLETHAYTLNGNALSFTDPNNNTTNYAYDGFDRLNQTTYPDTGTELYQYDANGNTTQKTTRSGQTIGLAYDALNRVSTKTPQGEAAGQVTYGYDLTGRLLQASDGSSTTPYQVGYDTAGRANNYTDQEGRNVQVQYDGVGNRTRLQWPAGTNGASSYFVTYKYDLLNRMTDILDNGTNLLAHYTWDSLSRQTSISYGDGTTDAYSEYDAADNLQTLTQTFSGGSNVTFSYGWQKNHQRASTSVSNGSFGFIPFTGTTTYGTPDPNNGYTSANAGSGNVTFSYDTNRNLTYDGTNTLTYDIENRLVQAQNLITTSQYLYDPLGNRKQKQVQMGGGSVITQFLAPGGEEMADYKCYSGTCTPWVLTVRGPGGLPVAAITPASGSQAETVVFYHHDVMGSTVASTVPGLSGAAEAYVYSDFGAPAGGSYLAYQFAGYRYDSETGLYQAGARYYSPTLGRFLQTDPIGTRGGNNLYAYVGDDPINMIDPGGLKPGDVYLATPGNNLLNFLNSTGQILLGSSGQYVHMAMEIAPLADGTPQITEEIPGPGAQIITLDSFLSRETGGGSEVDVYSPNTPLTNYQISGFNSITANAEAAQGMDYGIGPFASYCSQYVNDLVKESGAAPPIGSDSLFTFPSDIDTTTTYSQTGLYTPDWNNGSHTTLDSMK